MMQVVEIHWLDAHVSTDDISIKAAQKTEGILTETIGYLIADNDAGLVVAMDRWPKSPKHVKVHTFIPWGMVVDWWSYED